MCSQSSREQSSCCPPTAAFGARVREQSPGRFTGLAGHKALPVADSAPCLPGATAGSALHPQALHSGSRHVAPEAESGIQPSRESTHPATKRRSRHPKSFGICDCPRSAMSGSVWGLNPGLPAMGEGECRGGAPVATARSLVLREHPLCRQPGQTDAYNHYFLTYWWGEINIL